MFYLKVYTARKSEGCGATRWCREFVIIRAIPYRIKILIFTNIKMTAYHGGKSRIGKRIGGAIYDVTKQEINFNVLGYCEPFCGMLGVYRHIKDLLGSDIQYKAGDSNGSVIEMWKAVELGWLPADKMFSEAEFNWLKKSEKSSALKGYVGHQFSFGGQFFKGYAPKYGRSLKSYSRVIKRIKDISDETGDVDFSAGHYSQFSNLKNFIIYCDPPYEGTEQYYKSKLTKNKRFDSAEFYTWCRKMAEDNIVLVSGYKMPKDFKKILSIGSTVAGTNKKRTENLFLAQTSENCV
jgi:DNA adenine methylase